MYETILIFLFICILTLLLVYVFRCKDNTESFITQCHVQSEALKKCMNSERKYIPQSNNYIPQSNNYIPQSNNYIPPSPEIINNDKRKVLDNMSVFIDNSREIFENVNKIGKMFDNMRLIMSDITRYEISTQIVSDAKIMEVQNMKLEMDSSIKNILQIIPRDYMFGEI